MTDAIFSAYGGKGTGSFTQTQLQSSYLLAEQQVSNYIGTLLLPHIITGTYPFQHTPRLVTDYGYVSRLIAVNVLTKSQLSSTCDLTSNEGCGFIYNDTFGYVDFRQVSGICGFSWYSGWPYSNFVSYNVPYQVQLVYEAGLPTGTANFPGILEALTIMAQIDLNEKEPGLVGNNEGNGDVGIQRFSSIDYSETRRDSSLKRTGLGDSPKANRAARLIDNSVRKARRTLLLNGMS